MIHHEEHIEVEGTVAEVFHYVSHFENIEQWDPGVVSARRMTTGPVRVGSEFKLQCRFFGLKFPMIYRVSQIEPPFRIVLVGKGETTRATDTIVMTPIGKRVRIDYRLDLDLEASGHFKEKLIRSYVRHIGRRAIQGLKNAFNSPRHYPEMSPVDRWMDHAILPGLITFGKFGYSWRKKSWSPVTSSLTGRTVVITGATSGIGFMAALQCAYLGAHVIFVGRNSTKVEQTRAEIIETTGNPQVEGRVADLSLKKEIRQFAEQLVAHTEFVHVLINNAGALFAKRTQTDEGIERSLAINLMSPFMLTTLLMPKLKASTPARVINVSSGGMYLQPLMLDDMGYEKEPYDGAKAYAWAKRGIVVLTEIWAAKYNAHGITVQAMHPGWVDTPGIEKSLPSFYRLTYSVLRTPEQGADTIVWLATAQEPILGKGGGFWFDRRLHPTEIWPGTKTSANDREKLLDELEKLSEIKMVD